MGACLWPGGVPHPQQEAGTRCLASPRRFAGQAGRAPSVLNGGLGEVNPIFWLALLLGFAALENGTLDYQFSGWQSSGKHWTSNP